VNKDRSVLVLSALGVAGLVGMMVAAIAMDRYEGVAEQLPYAVSGVMGGLGVLGFSLGIVAIQLSRRAAAAERRVVDALLHESAAWLATVRGEGTSAGAKR
jgi:F420-0:gamma-glutamyl ligase-like protein